MFGKSGFTSSNRLPDTFPDHSCFKHMHADHTEYVLNKATQANSLFVSVALGVGPKHFLVVNNNSTWFDLDSLFIC